MNYFENIVISKEIYLYIFFFLVAVIDRLFQYHLYFDQDNVHVFDTLLELLRQCIILL